MAKRTVSAVLWLFAVAWGFNYISLITGAPPILGILLGAAVAAFVGVDPLHAIWPARAPSSAAPSDAVATSGIVQTQV
jgi:hypothetical protein